MDNELYKKLLDIKTQHRDISLQHWLEYELFTPSWWIGVVMVIVAFIVLFKFIDRKRIKDLIIFGFFINVAATFLDVTGSEFVLWEYPIRVLPHIPLLIPIDFVMLPISCMFVYQYFPKWKSFIIVNTILSAIFSFLLEPLAIWINLYKLVTWRYIYSLPIYIVISIYAKFFTELISKKQIKDRVETGKGKNNI